MNRRETSQVVAYLREIYPQGAPVTEATINVWQDVLGEYQYEVAWEAARQVAGEWVGYTMPPPAAVKQKIKQMMPQNQTAIELWRVAEKAIKRGTVMTAEEFNQLPEPVKTYFGGVSGIRDLALLDREQMPNERARFLRNIEVVQARIEAQKTNPMLDHQSDLLE